MKRFLVFCTICIVTACLGLMVFKFMTLEETLTVNQTVFEVNIGDKVPVEIERQNQKGATIVHYESLNEDVVYYDQTLGAFYATALGGKATLRISANIDNFTPILISVTVGNGTETSPFFIKEAEDLAQIGVEEELEDGSILVKRPLDKAYSLISDIDMALYNEGEWQPVGSLDNPFTGTLYANNHTISNLKITANDQNIAGIFASLGKANGKSGTIKGQLNFNGADINGSFDYAGLVAGVNGGKIERINVENSSVISTKDGAQLGLISGLQTGSLERVVAKNSSVYSQNTNAYVGGLVGVLKTTSSARAQIARSYAQGVDVTGNYAVGGLVGSNQGAIIIDCYSSQVTEGTVVKGVVSSVTASSNTSVGGLVGEATYFGSSLDAIVMDSYSTCKIESTAQKQGILVGYSIDENRSENKINRLQGLYYDAVNGLFGVGYINQVGAITSQATEEANYEYIYNNLTQEATETRKFKSHDDYTNSVTPVEYCWPINEVWLLNGGLPQLDIDGPYYDYTNRLNTITNKEDIRTASDLMRVYNDLDGNYVLRANIDLSANGDWSPIGTKENPFTGTFTCETDENGNPLWTISNIKMTASAEGGLAGENADLAGFFGVLSDTAKVSNIILTDVSINRGQKVAGIAAINYGVISNCQIVASTQDVKITTNNVGYTYTEDGSQKTDNNVYVGGITALNYGVVDNCFVKGYYVGISISTNNTVNYVAGIAAVNTGTVQSSKSIKVSGTPSVIEVLSYGKVYVAGIVAQNNSIVSSCGVNIDIKTKFDNDNAFTGGVVALNENNASLTTSYSDAIIEGTNVGGVVGLTYGKVSESYAINTITGKYVGGVAYSVADGEVSNCYSGIFAMGSGDKSVKCGLAYSVLLASEDARSASMKNCFSYVSFDGTGKNYFDTQSQVRKDDQWYILPIFRSYREAGWLINCIYDREVGGDATRSNWLTGTNSFPWRDSTTIINDYNSDVKYSYEVDTGLLTAEIQSTEGANVFRTYGFDENIWNLVEGQYPTLKNVAQR